MSKNYDNIRVFADEETAVSLAPKGTTLPTDLVTPLPAAFEEVGWLSEDGITEGRSTEVTKIKAFQGGKTVRSRPKSTERTLKFTALETKLQTLRAYYGGTITPTTATGVTTYQEPESAGVTEFVCVVDKFDGDVHMRKVYQLISVGERGDIQSNGDSGDFYEYTSDVIGPVTVISNDPALAGV